MKTISTHTLTETNIEHSEQIAVIDDVCRLLDDGKWRTFDEIAREVGLSPISLESVLSFLRKYQFIEMSMKSEGKARIKKGTPKLKPAVYILKGLLDAEHASVTRRRADESKKCMAFVMACKGRRTS